MFIIELQDGDSSASIEYEHVIHRATKGATKMW